MNPETADEMANFKSSRISNDRRQAITEEESPYMLVRPNQKEAEEQDDSSATEY